MKFVKTPKRLANAFVQKFIGQEKIKKYLKITTAKTREILKMLKATTATIN